MSLVPSCCRRMSRLVFPLWKGQLHPLFINHSNGKMHAKHTRTRHGHGSILNKSCRPLCSSVEKETKQLPVLTLYTKDPCSLCDDAVEELQPYRHRIWLEKVDITLTENKAWYKKYRYDIPVFHFNGAYLMKHRVDRIALENELSKWEQSDSPK